MKKTSSKFIQNLFTSVLIFSAFFLIWDYGWEFLINDNIPELMDTIFHSLYLGIFVGVFFYLWKLKPTIKEQINKS